MIKAVALALFAAAVTMLVINYLFAIPVLWAVALSLPAGGLVLLGSLLSGPLDANWDPVPSGEFSSTDLRASTLAIRLAEAAGDQQRYLTRVRPRLASLALATLRTRPGTSDLTGLDDPRARAALDPELYRLLTDDRTPLPEPARLAELLDRLEGS
ncbi:MAG TPA: hypothetical protein VFV67_04810 [Actinophytocola sp.]|uniref:hypothetical protein n=1 Tax=Actinophytocola sp. TaxID=1872138 RepID=UPI002DB6B356|nr:hypothetical protein [Actinophytocola sp.]HEU5469951.1 hypothetical protein [Actinophytocola sp.]